VNVFMVLLVASLRDQADEARPCSYLEPDDCPACHGEGVRPEDIESHEEATGCSERHDFEGDRVRCHCGEYLAPCSACVGYSLGRSRPEDDSWAG
jgi:hypothetical protein